MNKFIIAMDNPIYQRRRILNRIVLSISSVMLLLGLFWLSWIILTLLYKGIPTFTYAIFLNITPPPGEQGGLINALIGSIMMIGGGVSIGVPIGILAGTYLAEYGKKNFLSLMIKFLNEVLLSAPSIIIGLFVYTIYVAQVGHYSGWAGSFALSILVIPTIIHTTENILVLIPNNLREAAVALGCPKWRMIITICYRAGRSGIMTGVLLSLARISGETAPLLFTALSNQFMSFNMNAPIANLPVVIYQYATSPFKDWNNLAWSGALLITSLVFMINLLARNIFCK